ncbi:MAG TPA: lipopolysaccharide biosynthesis protein [Bacteroidia bacterium]|nr:lipopolysaccharide biosynthesis protein [Bacteroidia bacterium]
MSELKRKAQRAIIWDLAGTFSQHGIGFIISIFLARILHPTEFGLVGIALVIINLLQIFSDFGFASALIQNKNNTSLTYSSVFYINIGFGIFLVLLFQIAAPFIGEFYHNNKITDIIRWLSLTIFISSLNIVQRTILARNINFKTLTIRQVISQCIGGIIGIYLAFNKWGVYALVAQNLIATLVDVLILWRISDWHPKLEFSWKEVKKLTAFSSYSFMSQLLNRFFSRLDVLIVGKIFTPAILGYYSRADSVNALVTKYSSSSITKVFYPILSKVQDDDVQYKVILFRLLHFVAFISFLLTGIMVFAGRDIIILLFGKKWEPSVLIFQILALKSFVLPINSIIVSAFLAKGKSKENFWYGNVRRLVLVPMLFFAYFLGFQAFLWSVVGVAYANWLFNNFIVTRHLNISFKKQLNTVFPYLVIFVSGYFLICLLFYDVKSFLFLGVLKSLVYIVYYLLANFLLKTDSFIFVAKNGRQSWGRLKGSLKKV